MSIGNVACVGIYVVDAIAKPIDRVPRTGTLELFDHLTLHVGGCANNAAISAIGTTTGLRDFDGTLALWSDATGTPFPE